MKHPTQPIAGFVSDSSKLRVQGGSTEAWGATLGCGIYEQAAPGLVESNKRQRLCFASSKPRNDSSGVSGRCHKRATMLAAPI
jgi:hypothetical protein